MRSRRSQRGFTLIELMVSLVLFALVVAGIMSVAVTMVRGFQDQEATISTESSTRGSLDFMANALRSLSPGVPNNAAIYHVNTCAVGAITVQNNQATPFGHLSDRLTLVYASGGVVTTFRTAGYTGAAGPYDVPHSANQFRVGDTVMITDFATGHLATVSAVDLVSNPNRLSLTPAGACIPLPPDGYIAPNYAAGATVIRVQRAQFFISNIPGRDAGGPDVPALMIDPDAEGPATAEPLAEGVEDMQIAVGLDTVTADNVLTEVGAVANDDEWKFNVAGESLPIAPPNPYSRLRALRITLVARSTVGAQGINAYVLPAIEDRPINGTTDDFRRRILTSIIEVRNLTGSP